MFTTYHGEGGKLVPRGNDLSQLDSIVWIDLLNPDKADEAAVEAALKFEIPTRDDMQEIEVSSRLYDERGALFLIVQVVAMPDAEDAQVGPVTFVVLPGRLVTVRYHSPRSIAVFAQRAQVQGLGCTDGVHTMVALFETLVDRLADILEGEARKLDVVSRSIFAPQRASARTERLEVVLQRIGRAQDVNAKVAESLSTLQRVLGFLAAPAGGGARAALKGIDKARLKTLIRDVRSLQEAAVTQGGKILFMLDATLGVINIRQSDIIKVFSVVAFVFLPPTLIASIYGMNFARMPELDWQWGYPMAIGLMVVSAFVPWAIFRWKKWL